MPIKVKCQCGKVINAPDKFAGKTAKCPGCGEPLKIPDPNAAPAKKPAAKGASTRGKGAGKPSGRKPPVRPAPSSRRSKGATAVRGARGSTAARGRSGRGERRARGDRSARGGRSRRGGGPKPIEGALAGIGARFLAFFVDGIIAAGLAFGVAFLIVMVAGVGAAQNIQQAAEGGGAPDSAEMNAAAEGFLATMMIALPIALASFFGTIFLYYAVLEGLAAATLGKLMLGLRVTDAEKKPCGFVKAVIRNLIKTIPGLNLISCVCALFMAERKALHDLAAGTIVIKKGAPEEEETDEDEESEEAEDAGEEDDDVDEDDYEEVDDEE